MLADTLVNAEEQSWFFDGYGAMQIDSLRLTYCRCVSALHDVAGFAVHVLDGTERPQQERAHALGIVQGLLSPTGNVNRVLALPEPTITEEQSRGPTVPRHMKTTQHDRDLLPTARSAPAHGQRHERTLAIANRAFQRQ